MNVITNAHKMYSVIVCLSVELTACIERGVARAIGCEIVFIIISEWRAWQFFLLPSSRQHSNIGVAVGDESVHNIQFRCFQLLIKLC